MVDLVVQEAIADPIRDDDRDQDDDRVCCRLNWQIDNQTFSRPPNRYVPKHLARASQSIRNYIEQMRWSDVRRGENARKS